YAAKTIAVSQLQPGQDNTILLNPAPSSLKEVVVSGRWSSGPLQTISKLDIHLNPILNSQEVLRIVPGLFIGQHAGGGKAEQIFLRGFDIDHGTDIRLTADGLPVNMVSHAHGQGYADLHFIIPEMIENVNFGKGPYNTDKGNFATAGYVDYKTRNFLDNNFAKVEIGQFNTGRVVAGINLLPKNVRQQKNQSLIFSGEAMTTDGFFESSQDFTRFNGMLKYHGQVSPKLFVTAFASGFSSEWLASGQIPVRAVEDGTIGWFGAIDDTEGGKTSRYNASVALQTYLPNGMQWKNQVYYSRYLFDLYSNFTFFLVDPVNGDQIRQKEARNIWGYNSTFDKNHYLGSKRAWLQAGAQIRYDKVNVIELSRTKNRTEVLERLSLGDINELNAALFVEEKVNLSSALDITVGLRGDYFQNNYANRLDNTNLSSNSFMASPKLNIDFRPNKNLKIYWHNGQGFHTNDTRVAVQKNGRDVVTPAWGSDLGAMAKLGEKLVVQSALWYLFMQQEFVYVGDAGVVEPGGRTRRWGWDASVRYEMAPYLFADLNVNYAMGRAIDEPKDANRIPLAPIFTSTGGITYRKAQGFNGSLRYRYLGDRPANEDNSIVAVGHFIWDAQLNFTRKKWEAGLSVQNIFNTKWKETQFETESRLQNEPDPVSEIHFTPGSPFFARMSFTIFF
ncbi:MAG TPA: TonB-dependent receptor plug domain-containing protein, partial [Phnomibacter sp.]|nr:TonB-dependent receptor plug domain-containing protein [Phnomibacter sp.]